MMLADNIEEICRGKKGDPGRVPFFDNFRIFFTKCKFSLIINWKRGKNDESAPIGVEEMNLKMIGLIIGYILAIIFLFELYEHQLGAISFFILAIVFFSAAYRQKSKKESK